MKHEVVYKKICKIQLIRLVKRLKKHNKKKKNGSKKKNLKWQMTALNQQSEKKQ